MINENRRVIESLKTRIGLTKTEIPADANKDIENLHNEIRKLEDELRKIREEEPIKEEVEDEIQNLRNDLMLKLDDLKSKTSPPGEEGLKNAIEENKSSIERLRSLVTGRSPSAEIQALKGEMSENMKFMQELKRMVTEKKPAGKTVPVTDPETRKKLLQIEKNVESLSNKLQKMSEIKPIKIPEIPGTRGFRKTDESDMQNLRKSIDNILKKMDSFVSKEDMEKGFLERRLKTDKKMLTGGIYKEMEDIKKSILRNEDHVNNLVSDLEELKKEVSTIEKREWGKVGEKPDLEDIKERIEEIEHKLKVIGTSSPVFIE
jgi:chromosome segregation ATPase